MPGPLHGFRIIDLTSMISGPMATMILADQGAEVIKVENPAGGGDYVRKGANRRGDFSAAFLNNNRNKRSLALNLKDPRGLELLLSLAADADVFVQNFRPGVAQRIGLGEAALRKVAPNIVYVSISGFGEEGPFSNKPVYDPLVQAMSGLTTVQAGSDDERPRLVRTILPDKMTAITASQAITAALLARERNGQGQHVRLSMLASVVFFLWGSDMGSQTFVGNELPQQAAASFVDLVYESANGFLTVAVMSDKEWHGLTQALEKPEWLDDERFKTPAMRDRNINERIAVTQSVLLTRPADEWLERLTAAGVPCAPVLTRNEMIKHPQVIANRIIIENEHDEVGPLRQARSAAEFSITPSEMRNGAPRLGADSLAILNELGVAQSEIAMLEADGVVLTGR
ncbi:MAG: crotonobetainyl-CoA:carnitine CoA-transferase CaiB-like acyl-CoA transferase [Gammaproteobacteria bacterium]|jgi:crotonobetainyl-CoA:carnitine CoA-transferase CaiB-like acyl-CoA transferase